ncbi:MAG: hypothetical protein V1701_12720 [Planctomycetota bacterium]
MIWPVLGVVILTVTGCFKVDVNISVNPDGSGKIKQTIGLSKETFSMLNGMMSISVPKDGKVEKKDETASMEKEFRKLASSYGQGVYFESFSKETTKDEFICFNVTYTFTDITNIKIDPQSTGPIGSFMGGMTPSSASKMETFRFMLNKLPDGKATVLTIKSPLKKTDVQNPTKKTDQQEPKGSSQTKKKDEQPNNQVDMESMKQLLKGMRISLGLTCGTEIIETNASFRDSNKITFLSIDGDKLLASMDKWKGVIEKYQQSFTPDNIMNMKGAMQELSEMSGGAFNIDLAEEINIKFK